MFLVKNLQFPLSFSAGMIQNRSMPIAPEHRWLYLNHDPGDNRPRNLAALCQRCHMIHDASEHRRRRWFNAFHVRAIGDLFA